MFKLPLIIVYMIIAFNITAFAVLMQLDLPIFENVSVLVKVIAWILAIVAWVLAYRNRDKFVRLF